MKLSVTVRMLSAFVAFTVAAAMDAALVKPSTAGASMKPQEPSPVFLRGGQPEPRDIRNVATVADVASSEYEVVATRTALPENFQNVTAFHHVSDAGTNGGKFATIVAGNASKMNASSQRIFYKEIFFGAPWGSEYLEQDMRCAKDVRATEVGHVEVGSTNVQAVRVLYFSPPGLDATDEVLQAYKRHCQRTDLVVCVSPSCKKQIYVTRKSQQPAAAKINIDASCASLYVWSSADFSEQAKLDPVCNTDDWASNLRYDSLHTPDIVPLAKRCIY
eukprot:TRINITY_DN78991_c0_g1_i1.p1 TRINITY_DN78991_c0_g1~~TRINITY_DN78991_c0_g1_i1.p1  ORF type:complete len:275 (+),score=32.19 TRINITY_DN78991_c0_g1_i1:71-895(+)